MMALRSKFAFVHRQLWRDDWYYRASLFLGPAPIVGCLLGFVFWMGIQYATTAAPPNWATPKGADKNWHAAGYLPHPVSPDAPLPAVGADGQFVGYKRGWQFITRAGKVTPDNDIVMDNVPQTAFTIDTASVDMDTIMAKGPPMWLYAALGRGYLVVQNAGVYGLSLLFERDAGQPANCLSRLTLGGRSLVANLNLNLYAKVSVRYDGAQFDMRPGLYHLIWEFTCWHGEHVIGPGRSTLLIAHPGETTLQPADAAEFLRSETNP